MATCDLHVHSIYSTDSGNYALRRARLGESFTTPDRVYQTAIQRGMTLVTISDHNTLEGALRIADRPGTFLSVEVTTRFPEDGTPLHVLVWDLSEEDHRDLQPFRTSVYELVGFLVERNLAHALAHPLYRMGATLTVSHVQRLMLLFSVWEGRNGARPAASNDLACRLAAAVSPEYMEKLADIHGFAPFHHGTIGLTGGSDDHGALDIATTWTEADGANVAEFLSAVRAGDGTPHGEHGSTLKLAHAVGALTLNAYRAGGRALPPFIDESVAPLFDGVADAASRHADISEAASAIARLLGARARAGGIGIDALGDAGSRMSALLLAGGLELPYIASLRHHAGTFGDTRPIAEGFFGPAATPQQARCLVFTDTFRETNGVAGTMRRLAAAAERGELDLKVVTAEAGAEEGAGVMRLEADWSLPLPTYEGLSLDFPLLTKVLARVEEEAPDVIQVATPGPIGLCGLIAAKLLDLPLIGSYHTELGPYTLHLTQDPLVAGAVGYYVDWFYRRCDSVLAPTRAVIAQLERRGFEGRIGLWGRGVDTERFSPDRRSDALREELLDGGDVLLLSVGRISDEKRLDVLLAAFSRLDPIESGLRLVVAGDGPARARLEQDAPAGVAFLGELRGEDLARLYASADLFCFPSTTDTFGQVLLEAAASGLPAIAALAGGAPELVEHGRSGLLVPPDDPAAFAEAISTLAASPMMRMGYGACARARARERSWADSHEELRFAHRAAVGRAAQARREAVHA